MGKYMLFVAACITILLSCVNEPTFDVIPYIEFEGMTKNSMKQNSPSFQDSTLTTIYFEDGDGDLGGDSLAIFVTDTRTGQIDVEYRVTEIPIEGVSNAISGTISFPIYATCCIYDTGQIPCTPSDPLITQDVLYEIHIVDRAGNESNTIQIMPITLSCQ